MFQYSCLNPISEMGLGTLMQIMKRTENLEEADAVLVRSAKMHDMELPEKLLAVARAGAGVNNIPLELCAEHGIVVFNTPGANANGVKELVLAGMLLASRDIVGGVEWVKSQEDQSGTSANWQRSRRSSLQAVRSAGRSWVLSVWEPLEQLVANTATHLGMEVYGYDPYISVDAAWNLSRTIHHIQDVNDIYSECDYITMHVPLLDSTKGMISRDAIGMMKDGVVILNFARDTLVDEAALVEALRSGKVKKYVTDFANPTVAGVPGTLITPHLGASTEEAEDNCAVMAVKELQGLSGERKYPQFRQLSELRYGHVLALRAGWPSITGIS